jgi:CelD/BcsL family acetyltransferase involved in cellulose biosynthesis
MITCEIIKNPHEITRYLADWDRIFASDSFEPSTSFEWTQGLLSSTDTKNETLLSAIFKDSDNIIGIIPLAILKRRIPGMTLKHLIPISELYNTHSDLLIPRKDFPQFINTFFAAVNNCGLKWDVFEMSRILDSDDLCEMFGSYRLSNKRMIRRTEPSYYITLDNEYDKYLKKRSSKFRNFLKRNANKLLSEGQIEIRHYNDFDSIEAAFEQLIAIEKKSWKYLHGTSIASIQKQFDIYRHICVSFAKKKSLHLHFLYLNNEAIAFNIGLIYNNTYYYLKTSYCDMYKHLSPSTYLRAKLIEELIQNGTKYLDFPAEPYAWEQQWADELRWHNSIKIYNRTLTGTLFKWYDHLRTFYEKLIRRQKSIFHDPRDIKGDD